MVSPRAGRGRHGANIQMHHQKLIEACRSAVPHIAQSRRRLIARKVTDVIVAPSYQRSVDGEQSVDREGTRAITAIIEFT